MFVAAYTLHCSTDSVLQHVIIQRKVTTLDGGQFPLQMRSSASRTHPTGGNRQ